MELNWDIVHPRYGWCGYYNYYGLPAAIGTDAFGGMYVSIYNPHRLNFDYHTSSDAGVPTRACDVRQAERIALDGVRIEYSEVAGLLRELVASGRIRGRICDKCGQIVSINASYHYCRDSWSDIIRLSGSAGDKISRDMYESVREVIRKKLAAATFVKRRFCRRNGNTFTRIVKRDPIPIGEELASLLYYWSQLDVEKYIFSIQGGGVESGFLRWAIEGRAKEVMAYLQSLKSESATKAYVVIERLAKSGLAKPTSYVTGMCYAMKKSSIGWLWDETGHQ